MEAFAAVMAFLAIMVIAMYIAYKIGKEGCGEAVFVIPPPPPPPPKPKYLYAIWIGCIKREYIADEVNVCSDTGHLLLHLESQGIARYKTWDFLQCLPLSEDNN